MISYKSALYEMRIVWNVQFIQKELYLRSCASSNQTLRLQSYFMLNSNEHKMYPTCRC